MHEAARRLMSRRRALEVLAQLVGLWGLWILLAGYSPHELLVGVGAAVLGTIGSEFVRSSAEIGAVFKPRDVAQVVRVPGEVLDNTWVVLRVLGSVLAGARAGSTLRAVPFEAGEDGPALVGRKALTILYGTTAPNYIVVRFETSEQDGVLRLVYHQLEEAALSTSMLRLGARP